MNDFTLVTNYFFGWLFLWAEFAVQNLSQVRNLFNIDVCLTLDPI
jgi:hypothetical protein